MLQAERLAPEGQQQSANPVDADGLEDDRELKRPLSSAGGPPEQEPQLAWSPFGSFKKQEKVVFPEQGGGATLLLEIEG